VAAFPNLSLIIGGVASGKSRFAERLVTNAGRNLVYIATAEATDADMADKISIHRARRGDNWKTIEAPLDLVTALSEAGKGDVVLIDCLTLWLSNHMLRNSNIADKTLELMTALGKAGTPVVMVTNELGLGGVADNKLARRFQREQGVLNQKMAEITELVVVVTAGLPHVLKGALPEVEA